MNSLAKPPNARQTAKLPHAVDSVSLKKIKVEKEKQLPAIRSSRGVDSERLSALTASQFHRTASHFPSIKSARSSDRQLVKDLAATSTEYSSFMSGFFSPHTLERRQKIESEVDHHTYFAKVYCQSGTANTDDCQSRSRSRWMKSRSNWITGAGSPPPTKRLGHDSVPECLPQIPNVQAATDADTTVAPKADSGHGKQKNAKGAEPRRNKTRSFLVQQHHKIQREACVALRQLIFGRIGNEWWRDAEKHLIFEQSKGTEQEVRQLFDIWTQLDEDGSGDVDYREFLEFFRRFSADRRLGMKCVKYLVGVGPDEDDLWEEKKKGCTAQDLMRTIWLKAGSDDILAMLEIFQIAGLEQKRVQTPKMLSKRKRIELRQNFKYLDKEGHGAIAYADLIASGLIDEGMANELMGQYGTDAKGKINFEKFLEMWCPHGYRAHSNMKRVIDDQGRTLVNVNVNSGRNCGFTGWMLESDVQALQDMTEEVRIQN